jgi:hypothetical protein
MCKEPNHEGWRFPAVYCSPVHPFKPRIADFFNGLLGTGLGIKRVELA